jgi:ABC-type dipeptide/oligopeptide/nickel transport system permease component
VNFVKNFGWYTVKRTLMVIPLLFGVSLVAFFIIRLGDVNPAVLIAGPTASAVEIERVSQDLGLDRPLIQQYVTYLGKAVTGDLGRSWITGREVSAELRIRLPVTIELITIGTIASVLVGLFLGFVAGMRERSLVDHVLRVSTLGGISMPIFWLGLLLIYVLFFRVGLAPPPMGRQSLMLPSPTFRTGFPLTDALLDGRPEVVVSMLRHLMLPVITMALVIGATIAKQTRASVIEVRHTAMVRYARAIGMPQWRIWWLVLHNSLPSVVTFIAIAYSLQLGGSVLIELIFSWGGIGQLGVNAIQRADYAVVQAYIFSMGVLAAAIYLIADLVIAAIDPRVTFK